MEDNNSNQAQPEEKQTSIDEIKAEAETLLSQIKQVVENCQNQESSLNEKIQGLSSKTVTLTQEQGNIENLLQQITQAQQDVVSHKKNIDDIVQDVQEKQTTISATANEIQETKTVVDSNNEAIQELKTSIVETEEEATELKSTIDTDNSAIQQAKIEVEGNTKAIIQSKATVDQLEAELKAIADTADKKVEAVESFKTELEELNKKWINKFQAEFNRSKKSFTESQQNHSEEYDALKTQIENLLPGATSAGLASAFMDRKKSVGKFKWFWGLMVLAGAGGLIVVGVYTIKHPPSMQMSFYDFMIYLLTRSSILAGIILIEEFGRRHFNIISRLFETYAYKEVLSRSFEGYKEQMESVEIEPTITTVGTDDAGKETKKTVLMKASSKLSDNLLDNLKMDPSTIYEKEKPISTPTVDTTELAAQSINKAVEHLGKNKFDIGWRVFGIAIAVIIAIATTIILLVK
ncbi:MAG: hypothetical protein KAS96_12675 [Planctomycetes bacterium]|nr:hypothetical protein [Planctomycetota bacterium]